MPIESAVMRLCNDLSRLAMCLAVTHTELLYITLAYYQHCKCNVYSNASTHSAKSADADLLRYLIPFSY